MEKLQTKQDNPIIQCFAGVRGYVGKDDVAQLNLEDVARGLGFTTIAASGNEAVRWNTVYKYLCDLGVATSCNGTNYRKMCPEYIPEPIFYLLSMKAGNDTAKAFQYTIAYDVLPSIRKHGVYMTPKTIEQVLTDPDTIIRLATNLKEEREKNLLLVTENEAQKQIIADYTPKVQYVDKILKSKGTLTVKQIAADYDMTAQELNKILHEERIQYKVNDQWLLYKEHMGLGYTKSEPVQITRNSGQDDFVLHTKWTQKGRLFIHEILTRRGIVALIDRKFVGEQIAI